MKTEFSLNDLLDAYHVKCKELEHIRKIKDLLTDQNEKLIKSNFESEKVKELKEERIELNLIIEDLKAECSELRRDLDRERSFDRTKQAYRDTLKNTNIESNRFEPSSHIRWDDYNTGG